MTIKIYDNGSSIAFKVKVGGDDSTRLYKAMDEIKPFLDDNYPLEAVASYLQRLLPNDKIIIDTL